MQNQLNQKHQSTEGNRKKTKTSRQTRLTVLNPGYPGQPAPETHNSYSSSQITMTFVVTSIPSNHFHPFTTIYHTASLSFTHKVFISLSTTSLHVFMGLSLCVALSTSEVIHFPTQSTNTASCNRKDSGTEMQKTLKV